MISSYQIKQSHQHSFLKIEKKNQIFTSWGVEENSSNNEDVTTLFKTTKCKIVALFNYLNCNLLSPSYVFWDIRHPFLCWIHYSHQIIYWLTAAWSMTHTLKKEQFESNYEFMHSLATVILWSIDNTLSYRAE